MAEVTLLSQLSLWERDADDGGDDGDDGGDVKTNVCNQTDLQQTLETLSLKLYKRYFYKRLNSVILRKRYLYPFNKYWMRKWKLDRLWYLCYCRTRKSVLHTLWLHFQRADLNKNEKLSPEELIFYLGAFYEQKMWATFHFMLKFIIITSPFSRCLDEIFKKIGKKGTELTFLELYNALQK